MLGGGHQPMNDTTTTIHFSGERYIAPGLDFEYPGDYEVTEAKAAQLLADFPDRFSAVKAAPAKTSGKDHKKGNA